MLKRDLAEAMPGDIPQLNLPLMPFSKRWDVQSEVLQIERSFFCSIKEIMTEPTSNAILLMSG
jgi:hypothetical protein